jgi:type III restriction enzyme
MGTERERRQTLGRGLRLCANQKGERPRGFEINTLTVIATESYEEFAENLQKEIEKDTGTKASNAAPPPYSSTSVGTIPRESRRAYRRAAPSYLTVIGSPARIE